jgi:hypothetical protein
MKKAERIVQIDTKTFKVIKTFHNMCEASRETGVNRNNISAVVNFRNNTAGGFKWMKLTDYKKLISNCYDVNFI